VLLPLSCKWWRNWWWFNIPCAQEVLELVVPDSSGGSVSLEMIVMGEYVLVK
jgi:hypothetical protein